MDLGVRSYQTGQVTAGACATSRSSWQWVKGSEIPFTLHMRAKGQASSRRLNAMARTGQPVKRRRVFRAGRVGLGQLEEGDARSRTEFGTIVTVEDTMIPSRSSLGAGGANHLAPAYQAGSALETLGEASELLEPCTPTCPW